MKSLILQTAAKLLFPLLLLFSVFLFLRGHNDPGGGFIGGLIGAAAFALFAISNGTEVARRLLRIDPTFLIGLGLLFAIASGIISVIAGTPYLTGQWAFPVILGTEVELGSPILFDIGVYLVVVGFTLAVIFSLEEEEEN
jgi:multicomponent Na+:H+ antiporter subunit B